MIREFAFIIDGNQEDPNGNPMPYTRTTQGAKWSPKYERYQKWKSYVVGAFIKEFQNLDKQERAEFAKVVDFSKEKPIAKSEHKQKMSIEIYYKDKTHADSDNVFKGIADALFQNDKMLMGDFDFFYSIKKQGKVTVRLEL